MLLNIKLTKKLITEVIKLTNNENQLANIMVWGEAGNGKSQIVKQVGKEMGIKVFDKRLSFCPNLSNKLEKSFVLNRVRIYILM